VTNKVSLTVYDMLGQEVRSLVQNQVYAPGLSEVTWDGKNNTGQPVSSGTYIYTLRFGNFSKSMKMMLVK
jgi:flagellar hook assembly protein FlgD